jgi:hypothetical protein
LDTSYVNQFYTVELGHAAGQTFFAPQTEIQAITAWRSAFWTNNVSVWRMFIMAVDSTTGVPDPNQILQNGPTLVNAYGDGVHPTPFRFVFDPPVVLPAPGEYEFAIQGDQCDGVFDLAGNESDGSAYPSGVFWLHGRQATYCYGIPSEYPDRYADSDLAFTVEFCEATPVTPTTWGHIKALYR